MMLGMFAVYIFGGTPDFQSWLTIILVFIAPLIQQNMSNIALKTVNKSKTTNSNIQQVRKFSPFEGVWYQGQRYTIGKNILSDVKYAK